MQQMTPVSCATGHNATLRCLLAACACYCCLKHPASPSSADKLALPCAACLTALRWLSCFRQPASTGCFQPDALFRVPSLAGVTPLLYLDTENDEKHSMAAGLLAAGADVNAASTQPFTSTWPPGRKPHPCGTTFLHQHLRCARWTDGMPDCVQRALRAGANVGAVDGLGRTQIGRAHV